jgi:CDP-4-dehydro-6-deoxyglucose reductase, E3
MHITLEPQGRELTAEPGETVLEAALRAHINLPHSCKRGTCGACRATLVAGEIRYGEGAPAALSLIAPEAGEVLLCQALPVGDIRVAAREIRRVTDVEIRELPCRIERLERLTPDVMRVYLRLPAVENFPFQPGQYLDVMLDDTRRRSFSIACPPHDAALLELHVRRVPGGDFTEKLFSSLQEKALLRIEGPLGRFVYREPGPREAGAAILAAGGTGFSPLKAILRHVLESGSKRRLHLYWGVRTRADLYEDAWLRTLAARFPHFRYTPVLSEPARADLGQVATGLVHEALLADWPSLVGMEVYAAGPPPMIEALRQALPWRGLPPEQLYFDSFDFARRPGAPHAS